LPHQHPLKSGRVYLDIAAGVAVPAHARELRVQRITETAAYARYGARG
jgi:hypothetical protein